MKNRLPSSLSVDKAMNIAIDAYIYGFPLVLMDVTRQVFTAIGSPDDHRAPINQFAHMRTFPDSSFTYVVSPNTDTLYSIAWLDLSREPMVLSVPAMDRYYLMQMLDAWTNVFASPGTRTTGNDKRDFAIVGPSWRGKVPHGLTAIHAPTRIVSLGGRTQTNGQDDYKSVNAIQDQYQLIPLSSWGKPYAAPKSQPFSTSIDVNTPPIEQVMKMAPNTFFSRLNMLMKDNPPAVRDSAVLGRVAAIGVAPARPFSLDGFETDLVKAVHEGVEAAQAKIVAQGRKPVGQTGNGWESMPEDTGNFGTDYNSRAFVAVIGLGANLPQDAIYLRSTTDAEGRRLNGKNAYVIHFLKGQLPPVNAFWSVTAYNSKQFFIPNPINRYAIGDRDPLKIEDDGSLTIHVSNISAGPGKESNWLPVSPDLFSLMMRLYWPKNDAVNGTWRAPRTERVRT